MLVKGVLVVKLGAAGAIGGLVAGVVFWVLASASLHVKPVGMSYADLAATMLSAVSVLVTILGVFIAILAVWGYSQFKGIASAAAMDHVDSQLRDGEVRNHIEILIKNYLEAEFKSGALRTFVEERIDYIIFSNASERAKEEADAGGEDEE